MITYRPAGLEDAALLGELNAQLIQDEGHENPMSVGELVERMAGWLAGDYRAIVFLKDDDVAAYALYREEKTQIYLRQFFVQRSSRRLGIGRECIGLLLAEVWPRMRIVVEVLTKNEIGTAFWREVGFADYSLALERCPE